VGKKWMCAVLLLLGCLSSPSLAVWNPITGPNPIDVNGNWYIAESHDGNSNDEDDYGAVAWAIAMVGEANLQAKLLHVDVNCNMNERGTAGRQAIMYNNAKTALTDWGFGAFHPIEGTDYNTRILYNDCDQTHFNTTTRSGYVTQHFKYIVENIVYPSGATLYYNCAGPMDVPYYCIAAVTPSMRSCIRPVSHSTWNDCGHQEWKCWNAINTELGVTLIHIGDQNSRGFNTNGSCWDWVKGISGAKYTWLFNTNVKAAYDISDAGMTWYVLTGRSRDTWTSGDFSTCGNPGPVEVLFNYNWVVDNDPPTPNPAEVESTSSDDTSITVTAAAGTDAVSPPVQYFFDETSGNFGGTDSVWQASRSYTDTGLRPGTAYSYRVQMRDAAGNMTEWSTTANVSTTGTADTTAPTPNPGQFETAPAATGTGVMSMTAVAGTDASGPVQYYFDETSGHAGGTDSGWQASTSYTDVGLTAGTLYTYTVKMRDAWNNEGGASGPGSDYTFLDADVAPDGYVDIKDLAAVVARWLDPNCAAPDWCGGTDLNTSGQVELGDYALLGAEWGRVPPLLPDPVAWWKLDESSGTTASDSIGSRHGTVFNMENDDWVAGKSGNCLDFDGFEAAGIGEYVSVPLAVQADWTISFWMQADNPGADGPGDNTKFWNGFGLVNGESTGYTKDYGISIQTNDITYGVGDTGVAGTNIVGNDVIMDTNWHHVAATRVASTGALALYVDGLVKAQAASGPTWTTASITKLYLAATNVGTATPEDTKYFVGQLDDVRIFNVVLTPAEIAELATP